MGKEKKVLRSSKSLAVYSKGQEREVLSAVWQVDNPELLVVDLLLFSVTVKYSISEKRFSSSVTSWSGRSVIFGFCCLQRARLRSVEKPPESKWDGCSGNFLYFREVFDRKNFEFTFWRGWVGARDTIVMTWLVSSLLGVDEEFKRAAFALQRAGWICEGGKNLWGIFRRAWKRKAIQQSKACRTL